MDLSVYAKQKAASLQILVKVGPDTVAYLAPKFDAATGAALPADVTQFNLQGLDDAIAQQTTALAQMVAFRADCAAVLK